MSNENIGTLSKLVVDTALPFDANSIWLPFLSEGLTKNEELRFIPSMTGSRSRLRSQYRIGPQSPSGNVKFACDRKVLDNWLPAVLGRDEDANTFDVDLLLPEIYVGIDKGIGFFTYGACKVNTGMFSKGGSDILEMSIDLHAETETFNSSYTFPVASRTFEQPYQFADSGGSMTFKGASRGVSDWNCKVDNKLVTNDFNGLTRDGTLRSQDREVGGMVTLRPLPSNAGTYNTGLTPSSGSIVFTHAEIGANVLSFLFYNIMFPGQSPKVGGRQIYDYPIEYIACADDDRDDVGNTGNPDMRVTNVH